MPKTTIAARFALIFFVLFFSSIAHSQRIFGYKIFEEPNVDTSYIESYYNDLTIGLSIPQKFANLSIKDDESGSSLEYTPNTKVSIGIKASYKWLDISLGLNIPETTKEKLKYGESKKLDIQVNTYLKFFSIDAYVQRYKGLYLDNMNDYFQLFNDDDTEYYVRKDIQFTNIGLSTKYVLNNKKFSYKAPFSYSQKQKKRAGSFLFGTFLFRNSVTADFPLVPDFAKPDFGQESMFTEVVSYNIGLNAGYIYTFVMEKYFYITLEITPGLAIQTIKAIDENDDLVIDKSGLGVHTISRFSLGYSKKRFYASFTGIYGLNNLINKDKNSIEFGYGTTRFTIGYRFNLKGNTHQIQYNQ